jgi:diacylglycerol kinase (ATP)
MKESRGPMRAIKAAQYSWQGLSAAFKNEEAFRQELTLCLILAPVAFWLGETGLEKAVMIGTLILVLITELLNSAVEAVVDRVGTEHHELSGRAKDIGSAAVMLSLLNVPICWGIIYFL